MGKFKRIINITMLGLGVLFMAGCVDVPVSEEPTDLKGNEEQVETYSEGDTSKVNKDDTLDSNSGMYIDRYIDYMQGVAKGIDKSNEHLTLLAEAMKTNPAIVNDDIFKESMAGTLDFFTIAYGNVDDITPPDSFAIYHSLMLNSLKEYENGTKLFSESIAVKDSDKMSESVESIFKAMIFYNEATEELAKLSN